MSLLAKLLKKQKCLSDHILSLKPQHTDSEEAAELSYSVLCKFDELLRANKRAVEKLSSEINRESRMEEYRRSEENLRHLKSVCAKYMNSFSQSRLTYQRCTVVSQEIEIKKQICLINTVARMEPVNAVSYEEIELYEDLLEYICNKFEQIQCDVESYMRSEDYQPQCAIIKRFYDNVKSKKSILASNIALLRNLDNLCS